MWFVSIALLFPTVYFFGAREHPEGQNDGLDWHEVTDAQRNGRLRYKGEKRYRKFAKRGRREVLQIDTKTRGFLHTHNHDVRSEKTRNR